MNVGRQWVRRLALLLAAGVVVVQVPALVGIGLSGASAAHPGPTPTPKHTRATATPTPSDTPTATPTPSYSVSLSISNCVATVTASWTNAPVQDVQLYVRDLTTSTWEPDPSTAPAPEQPVSGTSGSLSDTFQLNPLLAGAVMVHSFDAMANFYSGGSLLKQAWANSYNAPCYLGQLGQVGL
jgi:hypothetical protein